MRQTHRATAISRLTDFRPALLGLATGGAALILSTALAARADGVTISHGYSNFGGELKYPADMTHLDYVNPPDAPKGGARSRLRVRARSTVSTCMHARGGWRRRYQRLPVNLC